jgi:hypothetical protein
MRINLIDLIRSDPASKQTNSNHMEWWMDGGTDGSGKQMSNEQWNQTIRTKQAQRRWSIKRATNN